jgi:hypothetical protein
MDRVAYYIEDGDSSTNNANPINQSPNWFAPPLHCYKTGLLEGDHWYMVDLPAGDQLVEHFN